MRRRRRRTILGNPSTGSAIGSTLDSTKRCSCLCRNGYRRVPSPLRACVHNFFANLAEVDTVINYTLQGRLGRGVTGIGKGS